MKIQLKLNPQTPTYLKKPSFGDIVISAGDKEVFQELISKKADIAWKSLKHLMWGGFSHSFSGPWTLFSFNRKLTYNKGNRIPRELRNIVYNHNMIYIRPLSDFPANYRKRIRDRGSITEDDELAEYFNSIDTLTPKTSKEYIDILAGL